MKPTLLIWQVSPGAVNRTERGTACSWRKDSIRQHDEPRRPACHQPGHARTANGVAPADLTRREQAGVIGRRPAPGA
jgi:hypothetical protein